MDHFTYREGNLYCEEVAIDDLARQYGTPLFVYSQATLLHHLRQLQSAFAPAKPLICYSLKANPNIHLCRIMREHGAGFDVTSAGELYRALQAGGIGEQIVFAGVGKTAAEHRYGLESNVHMFNVESEAELLALTDVAESMDRVARVALRVNPALPPKTHIKTDTSVRGTKFGLDIDSVVEFAQGVAGRSSVSISGLHMHLGSPILDPKPYEDGIAKALELVKRLRGQGHPVESINMGGGFGIHYKKQEAKPASAFAEVIVPGVTAVGCRLILEPGRFIVGNAGVLISRVIFTKDSGGKHFVIQDAAMNDLIRPTLYDSFHRIWPVAGAAPPTDFEIENPGTVRTDVVGPVCETGDFLARDRFLPPLGRDGLLATFSAGAYGMAMSSNYNSRLRAAEVLVAGSTHRLIRRRETFADLVRTEIELS
jgi:diaminopimelate decarboxylase